MGKELEGCIVLSLFNTLWLNPLHERKHQPGTKAALLVMDVRAEVLGANIAEKNEGHMMKLVIFLLIVSISCSFGN